MNITCNQNMWHDMAIIILCLWSLSPNHRHDLHHNRLHTLISIKASLSSRQLLLVRLSLPLSDKVKQLHGDCISYNKAKTIRLLPVSDNFYKTWSSHTTIYISSCLDHIYYMIHVQPFGLSVPRPYLHMLGSSSLTRVFCTCKTGLHPLYVNVELITPDHHVVSRHDEQSQWCILRENTYTLKFSEGSSYNSTAVLSKIRCIKDKHHMQSK